MSHKPEADAYLDASIVLADMAASCSDQSAGTASLRTLGTGAAQAAPGNTSQQISEKGAASGYASLDGSTLVPTAQLGSGTANSGVYLRGDRTWAAVTASYGTTTSTKTANYTTTATDDYILVDASGGSRTITLHAAATATKPVHIKRINSGANTVIIDPNSTETVDGATTRTLTQQYEAVSLVSDGSNWYVF